MSMSVSKAIYKVIFACTVICAAGLGVLYFMENILSIDVNAKIVALICVAIGAGYISRVIKPPNTTQRINDSD